MFNLDDSVRGNDYRIRWRNFSVIKTLNFNKS